jgi:hypothetical protein
MGDGEKVRVGEISDRHNLCGSLWILYTLLYN